MNLVFHIMIYSFMILMGLVASIQFKVIFPQLIHLEFLMISAGIFFARWIIKDAEETEMILIGIEKRSKK